MAATREKETIICKNSAACSYLIKSLRRIQKFTKDSIFKSEEAKNMEEMCNFFLIT